MQFTLTAPMVISSRLMPAVKIGAVTVSVYPHQIVTDADGARLMWFYALDRSSFGTLIEGHDLGQPYAHEPTGQDARAMMATLLDFLSYAAESYRANVYPDGGWVFSETVDSWAHTHEEEIAYMAERLDDNDSEDMTGFTYGEYLSSH